MIIGVNTSSLKMVSLVKCGRWEIRGKHFGWEIGDQNLWEVGDWGLNMWEVGD